MSGKCKSEPWRRIETLNIVMEARESTEMVGQITFGELATHEPRGRRPIRLLYIAYAGEFYIIFLDDPSNFNTSQIITNDTIGRHRRYDLLHSILYCLTSIVSPFTDMQVLNFRLLGHFPTFVKRKYGFTSLTSPNFFLASSVLTVGGTMTS